MEEMQKRISNLMKNYTDSDSENEFSAMQELELAIKKVMIESIAEETTKIRKKVSELRYMGIKKAVETADSLKDNNDELWFRTFVNRYFDMEDSYYFPDINRDGEMQITNVCAVLPLYEYLDISNNCYEAVTIRQRLSSCDSIPSFAIGLGILNIYGELTIAYRPSTKLYLSECLK